VAVEIAAQGRWSEADTGEFSALCVSGDGGLSFRKLRQDRMVSGPDWCGVAL
jgi:hypothetical protein